MEQLADQVPAQPNPDPPAPIDQVPAPVDVPHEDQPVAQHDVNPAPIDQAPAPSSSNPAPIDPISDPVHDVNQPSSIEPPQLKLPNVRAVELNYDFAALHAAYDVVIDIHSIQHAKLGWGICGKNWEKLSTIFARLVGVVGDFKDGKTFVTSLLAQRPLPHNATQHTPGLCLTLSRLPSTPQQCEANSRSGKPLYHMQTKAEEGMELLQDCYIDTEGTDQPVTGINSHFFLFYSLPYYFCRRSQSRYQGH